MITFEHPYFLICIPFLFFVWIFFARKKYGFKPLNPIFEKYLHFPFLQKLIFILRFFIVAIICIIISKPTFITEIKKKVPEKQNTMIIFDVSRSMISEDLIPSRIEVAKNILKDFIQKREGDSFGLIIFAGKPFLTIANSSDKKGILNFIDEISPNSILQEKPGLSGTNIGDAILLANLSLEKQNGIKNIILITDGSANIGSNPLESAEESKEKNITIYSIGIGSKNNEPLFYTDQKGEKIFFYDANGEKIISDLDNKMLAKIAKITNGKYFSTNNIQNLEDAFNKTNKSLGNNFIIQKEKKNISCIPFFLILLFILLFIENKIQKKYLHKYSLL